jgi:hypothetical protein
MKYFLSGIKTILQLLAYTITIVFPVYYCVQRFIRPELLHIPLGYAIITVLILITIISFLAPECNKYKNEFFSQLATLVAVASTILFVIGLISMCYIWFINPFLRGIFYFIIGFGIICGVSCIISEN